MGYKKKVGVCVAECSMMEKNAENPPLNIWVGITFYFLLHYRVRQLLERMTCGSAIAYTVSVKVYC